MIRLLRAESAISRRRRCLSAGHSTLPDEQNNQSFVDLAGGDRVLVKFGGSEPGEPTEQVGVAGDRDRRAVPVAQVGGEVGDGLVHIACFHGTDQAGFGRATPRTRRLVRGGSWTNSSTPTFTWKATTDAGSGLAKYQVWIDNALVIDSIPAIATTATATSVMAEGAHLWQVWAVDNAGAVRRSRQGWTFLTEPLYPEQHYWEIYAFDRLGGSVKGDTPDGDRAWFTASCTGACLSLAEPGPEPTPEPPRDAGVDAPDDSAQDSSVATAQDAWMA